MHEWLENETQSLSSSQKTDHFQHEIEPTQQADMELENESDTLFNMFVRKHLRHPPPSVFRELT